MRKSLIIPFLRLARVSADQGSMNDRKGISRLPTKKVFRLKGETIHN